MLNINPGYIYTQRPDKADKTLLRYVCLAVHPHHAEFLRIGDGWRFNAFFPELDASGYISWSHSAGGHWDQEPTDQVVRELNKNPNRLFPCEVRLQESIVNIALIVGQLMAEGKIDPQWSHNEIISSVIDTAYKFEIEFGEMAGYDREQDWVYDFLNTYGAKVDINVPQKKANLHDFQATQFSNFKDRDIFNSHPDCVCYGGEYVDEVDDLFTRYDFIELCGGDIGFAEQLFDMCEWQSPHTLIDEWGIMGEVDTCSKCGKLFMCYEKTRCSHCGATYFPNIEPRFKSGYGLKGARAARNAK